MGFPVGYSEFLLPKVCLHLVFLLGHIRRLISWIFEALGLGDLLLDAEISPSARAAARDYSAAAASERHRGRQGHGGGEIQVGTSRGLRVCLQEFAAGDEARRPGNCRHVFHRCCLDRWTEHDQRTCPLCRTPLVPEELQEAFDGRIWAAAGEVPPFVHYYGDGEGFEYDSAAVDLFRQYSPSPLASAAAAAAAASS
ncbi:unnamed protein product [Spirodela intermedia]|uniref:RING-type domain-containing protein n=1 Tax=Spirodela intermedia TaxID=51605 RepID=A0A7I8JA40_SPIIN|nr:unnamed protein product [Spirodela intermedia]CAA6666959.1 unnamed protein product [Spirodela intermedia]